MVLNYYLNFFSLKVLKFLRFNKFNSYDGFLAHWAQLFKNYPERIIFGSDWKYQRRRGYANYDYGEHIAMVRRMIGSFPVNIQEKIAYKNAMRVFNLQEN